MKNNDTTGYLYILSNESMAGVVKIGRTNRDPETRTQELSSATGVPTPFKLEYSKLFPDSIRAENLVHKYIELRGKRPNNKREFFNINVQEAIKIIEDIDSNYFNTDKDSTYTDYYLSTTEKDDQGNDINIKMLAEKTSIESDFYELTKTVTYKDNTKDIKTYLTNDLSAFFKDPSGPPEPLEHTEQLIEDLIWEGDNLLTGYGEDGIIDINKGLNLLEEAAKLESAEAYYRLGNYYLNKYIEDSDDESRLNARHYFSLGANYTDSYALICIYWLSKGYLYSTYDEGFDSYIINNNKLSYWAKYFKTLKELDGKYTISHNQTITESLGELFVNEFYIRRVNDDDRLRHPYSRAIEEGLDLIKYYYYDLIRVFKSSDYIKRNGQANSNKYIQFLEDIFNINSQDLEEKNSFKGNLIELVSYEKGNYVITGNLDGALNENDMVSLRIWPFEKYYFTVRKVEKALEKNKDLLYIEGIHPDYPYLASRIKDRQENHGIEYPIEVYKSASSTIVDKSIDDIVSYLLDKKFEKTEIQTPTSDIDNTDSDSAELSSSRNPQTTDIKFESYLDTNSKKNAMVESNQDMQSSNDKEETQTRGLWSKIKNLFNKR